MVFKAGNDPNRHMRGATPDPEKRAKKEAQKAAEKSKLRKLRLLLNKHIENSITKAATLMDAAVKEETQLKAAIYITDLYVKVHGQVIAEELTKLPMNEVGDGDDTMDDDSKDDSAAVFSLNLVNK